MKRFTGFWYRSRGSLSIGTHEEGSRLIHAQRTLWIVLGLTVLNLPSPTTAATTPIALGMDLGSIDAQATNGARPQLGMVWVGAWTLKSGWGGVDALFDRARAAGVTPVVQFYYWGNDISPTCLENGCWSTIQNAWKSRAGWDQLARELGDHLRNRMGGAPAIVVLETEFNKNGASRYEPLDGYLADKAWQVRNAYGGARIAVGFGNWDRAAWATFDRAMAASHYAGLQGLRAPTRDSLSSYLGIVQASLDGARELRNRFGKPVLLTDIGASSHWEPDYLNHQATVVGDFFRRIDEFRAAGVMGLVWRSFKDNPSAPTAEYFGEAERHWGLAWSDGRAKPAWTKWKEGAASAAGASTTASSTSSWAASFEAERFATKPVGGAQGDSAASGGLRWNLWSNSRISQPIQLPAAGTYELRVRAMGQLMNNVAPHMEAWLDDQRLGTADPGAGAWSDTTVRWSQPTAGTRTVGLQFTNDAYAPPADRNLLLDRVTIVRAA